ncbi:hypothetical protein ACJZ2D_009153 [Fusarium nematophilum]
MATLTFLYPNEPDWKDASNPHFSCQVLRHTLPHGQDPSHSTTRRIYLGCPGFLANPQNRCVPQRWSFWCNKGACKCKAGKIRAAFLGLSKEKLDLVVVPDVAATGAFQGWDVVWIL